MARKTAERDWSTATWKGARLAQLRAALRMSVRQRLLAMEELNDLALRLAKMPRTYGNESASKKKPALAKTRRKSGQTATAVTS
jgi:hypothetical protein